MVSLELPKTCKMNRKEFIKLGSLTSVALLAFGSDVNAMTNFLHPKSAHPLAITMWDFSWLERRWAGGGYEDWDKILDELIERGYNAVRIDAYPHLLGANPDKEWLLKPVWDQNDWGSPGIIKVKIRPALIEFIAKCDKRNIKVALSTWYREDEDNTRMQIDSPEKMAANWLKVLDIINAEKLLDAILYVDLCNELPAKIWTPYFKAERKNHDWSIAASMAWMKTSLSVMRKNYPQLPFTFSFDHYEKGILKNTPVPFLDFIEQHLWMSSLQNGEFNNKLGIDWNGFSSGDYKKLVEKAEAIYTQDKAYWNDILISSIKQLADDAKAAGQPLITTESWALVNYKDYPMLNWHWIKDLCELGVLKAVETQQWVAIATSNFCGPQFKGMWNDIAWHQRLTSTIKKSKISDDLKDKKIVLRLNN